MNNHAASFYDCKFIAAKMAVPARVLRFRGAGAASELARAGTIEVRAWDAVSFDQTGVWAPAHPKRAELYISWRNCQRFFVTNSTKKPSASPV